MHAICKEISSISPSNGCDDALARAKHAYATAAWVLGRRKKKQTVCEKKIQFQKDTIPKVERGGEPCDARRGAAGGDGEAQVDGLAQAARARAQGETARERGALSKIPSTFAKVRERLWVL